MIQPTKPAAQILPILPAIKPAARVLPNAPKPPVPAREPATPLRSDLIEKWKQMSTQRLEEERSSLVRALAKAELARKTARNPNKSIREINLDEDIKSIDAILKEKGAKMQSSVWE